MFFNLDFLYLAEALAQNSPPAKCNFEIIFFAETLAENAPPAKICFYKDVTFVSIEWFTSWEFIFCYVAKIFRQTFLTYASEIYGIETKILLLQ